MNLDLRWKTTYLGGQHLLLVGGQICRPRTPYASLRQTCNARRPGNIFPSISFLILNLIVSLTIILDFPAPSGPLLRVCRCHQVIAYTLLLPYFLCHPLVPVTIRYSVDHCTALIRRMRLGCSLRMQTCCFLLGQESTWRHMHWWQPVLSVERGRKFVDRLYDLESHSAFDLAFKFE